MIRDRGRAFRKEEGRKMKYKTPGSEPGVFVFIASEAFHTTRRPAAI
jgi:hypothetical protein